MPGTSANSAVTRSTLSRQIADVPGMRAGPPP